MQYVGNPIRVEDLTREKITRGEFQKELPELYRLKDVIENNARHDNESVFNHTMRVLYMIEQIKKFAPERIKNYLNQKLGENSQWNTLYIATIFHDIGKSKTLQKSKLDKSLQGKHLTDCPMHEQESARMVKPILNKIYLSDLEKNVIISTIEYHGHLHNIVHPKNENLEQQYDKLMSYKSDIAIELNMLAFANTLSSSALKITNPEEFKFRTDFYRRILNNY